MTESACKYCGMLISADFYVEKQCCHNCFIQNKPKIEQLEYQIEDLKGLLRQAALFCKWGSRYDARLGTIVVGEKLSLKIKDALEE